MTPSRPNPPEPVDPDTGPWPTQILRTEPLASGSPGGPSGVREFPATVAGPASGDLVILLHGFPQDRTTWDAVQPALVDAGFRTVAFDQRGYASTFRPAGKEHYTVDRLAADVLAVADHQGASRFHVVGHDWGGFVTWELAGRHADRLLSATAVSTPHPAAYGHVLVRSSQILRSLYVPFFVTPRIAERVLLARSGGVLRSFLVRSGLPEPRAAYYAGRMREPRALSAALNWYRAAVRHRMDRTPPSTVPTLYVWSPGDQALGRAAAEATEGHVDAPYRFVELDGVGHWIPETAPGRLVAPLLDHLTTDRSGG